MADATKIEWCDSTFKPWIRLLPAVFVEQIEEIES